MSTITITTAALTRSLAALPPSHPARRAPQRASAAPYLSKLPGNRGKTLERLIVSEQSLPGCPVVLTKVAQAAKRIGGGEVIAVKGPCDFFGTIKASGRSIVFDAKECAVTRFVCSTSTVKPEQINELCRHGRAKALAGLVCLDMLTHSIHWLDWTRLVQRQPSYEWETLPSIGSLSRGIRWASWLGIVTEARTA